LLNGTAVATTARNDVATQHNNEAKENKQNTASDETTETAGTPPPQKVRKVTTSVTGKTEDQSSNGGASRSPRTRFSSSNSDSRSNHHTNSNGPRNRIASTSSGNNSRGGGTSTTASSSVPPTNNTRIHDFFSAVGTKNKKSKTSINKTSSKADNGKSASGAGSGTTTKRLQNRNTPSPVSNSIGPVSNNKNEELLQAQCERLQQKLQDKEDQLRAVTNTRTIKHTALQSALTQVKEELRVMQQSSERKSLKFQSVIEELMRSKALKDAKDVRTALASDGTRLGRLVHVRVGMRVIDQWEDGYATHDLHRRKKELNQKKNLLLSRQKEHKKLFKQQQQQSSSSLKSSTDGKDDEAAGSGDNMTPLDLQEAKESIQMHLEGVKRQEHELLLEESLLNEEKAAHTRALKLVAAEDASTFSNRPKLHDRYVLDRLLGKGGFSEVWKAYDLDELREVAVKIHQLDPRWTESKKENYIKHVTREYEIHRQVRHPRIVSFYDVFEIDEDSFATVLEVCSGKDLDSLLKSKRILPEKQARAILLQILSGMRYLSQPDETRQGIIHYDLKPGNILFDEFGDAKITDFGLSKIVDSPDPAVSMELTSQGAGTYWYLPPECFVMDENVRISNKVDVWSIGVIFYQMLFGRRPFGEGKSQDKILADNTMLNADEVHFPDRPTVSDACKDFIRLCLTHDQTFRPTVAQLCEDSYVLQQSSSSSSATTSQQQQQQQK
jgi:tousled-like kinase